MAGGGVASLGHTSLGPEPQSVLHEWDRARIAELERRLDVIEVQASSRDQFTRWLEKALTYQTAVMAIAYAGFFVLWEKVDGVGNQRLHAVAGISIGLSLLVYIGWTLMQMHVVHQQLVGQEPTPKPEALDRAGPGVFMFSVVTGMAAAVIVMLIWFYKLLA